MKNFVLLFIVICSILLLTSCSFRVSFIVENLSRGSIIVAYEAKKAPLDNYIPRVKSMNNPNNENNWEELPSEKYKLDKEKGIIEVNLSSNQALQVAFEDPYDIDKNPYGDDFNLKNISIVGENGSIKVEGNQVFEMFRPENKAWWSPLPNYPNYIFRYRETIAKP
jgi:hypothetical protein